MSANDIILLEKLLEQQKDTHAPELKPDEFFEIFTAAQILKDADLSYDEIEGGIVGGTHDGGIDSMFTFVNGELIREDMDASDLSAYKRGAVIELVIIQSKTATGFSEDAIDKLRSSTEDLLDFSKSINGLKSTYNAELLEWIRLFRDTYSHLVSKFPVLRIRYFYASKGDKPHPNVQAKVDKLQKTVLQLFSDVEFSFKFIGAAELLELARRQRRTTYRLVVAETPIASAAGNAFVALASMNEFFKFISDEKGTLIRPIFESNVRDHQGKTPVNEEIHATLVTKLADEDFWWLNNGITVLAANAILSGKTFTIEDPQIVNGLQTSTELHRYFTSEVTAGDQRNILVRVIVPPKVESRDKIIKATNSQTQIPIASLRATEKIHRDIEEYFKVHGLFYDRRKNFYKNEGRPMDKIISIPFVAQSVMSVALQRPDTARARPSSLLKADSDYKKVFSNSYDIDLYLKCVSVMKRVDAFLHDATDLNRKDQTNLRFYLAMYVAALLSKTPYPAASKLAAVNLANVTPDLMADAFKHVQAAYESLGSSDQVAKGADLLVKLREQLAERLK